MKKKRLNSKLRLNREVVRHLNPEDLADAAGAFGSSSENCTQLCTNGYSDGGRSACLCPRCPDYSDGCDTTGPVYTGPFYPGCPSYGNQCTVGC